MRRAAGQAARVQLGASKLFFQLWGADIGLRPITPKLNVERAGEAVEKEEEEGRFVRGHL